MQDFIKKIEAEFDEIPEGFLKPETRFREGFEWTSVNALILFSMINIEYEVIMTAEDLHRSETVEDLFRIVQEKQKNG